MNRRSQADYLRILAHVGGGGGGGTTVDSTAGLRYGDLISAAPTDNPNLFILLVVDEIVEPAVPADPRQVFERGFVIEYRLVLFWHR